MLFSVLRAHMKCASSRHALLLVSSCSMQHAWKMRLDHTGTFQRPASATELQCPTKQKSLPVLQPLRLHITLASHSDIAALSAYPQ